MDPIVQDLLASLAEPMPKYLRLDESSIPGAGWGIFTDIFLPKGHSLGEYKGRWLTPEKFDDMGRNLYVWAVGDYRGNKNRPRGVRLKEGTTIGYIDGEKPEVSSFHRFVNHPRTLEEENLEAMQVGPKIFYVTKRNIQPGEELFVYYGHDYSKYLLGREL